MTFHPAPGQAGMPAAAPKKPSKVGKILMIIGGVILLLSIVVGVILGVVGFGGIVSDAGKNQVMETGTGTVEVEAGEQRSLYAVEGSGSVNCTVVGPDGADPVDGTTQTSTITEQGETWASFASFEATATGPHEIECDGRVMVGPPVSIGGAFAGVGGILAGILGGGLGVLLLIVGLVVHLMSRKKA